jgi:hypothetical protein
MRVPLRLMSRQLKRALLLVPLTIPFAELGHLAAYGVRVPASGVHVYYPSLLQFAGGALGAVLLASLAVLALARLVSGGTVRRKPWSFPLLFAGLLAAQVIVFLVQEGLESHSLPGLGTLTIGLLGQQPVALVAALSLRWLSARLGPAARALSSARQPVITPRPAAPLVLRPVSVCQAVPPATRVRARGQRAPPL